MSWTTKPPTVGDLLGEASGEKGVFLRAHPDPVLLVQGVEQGSDEVSSDRTIRLGGLGEMSSSGEIRSVTAAYAVAVKKQRSLGADKILVGRGRENDVVLPFKSVSRLHAFFRLGTDGLWTLEDAGSAYGTYVRDTRLTSGAVRALGDDTPVRFGGVEASFHSAQGFREFLVKLANASHRP
jgi:hypothetical protein